MKAQNKETALVEAVARAFVRVNTRGRLYLFWKVCLVDGRTRGTELGVEPRIELQHGGGLAARHHT